ncbi:MAG: hypothetical protein LBB13_01135, partial [Rickettsiales bacterium]|nr:hypothetical protein [Rickettsiales bacterium]
MKILKRKKIGDQLVWYILCSSLLLVVIFSAVTMAEAETVEVNDFAGLKTAIENKKTKVVIKKDIDFTDNNGLTVNYNDIDISGANKDAPGMLNGKSIYKLLRFEGDAKNILLKDLHLNNGYNGDDFNTNINSGGGAIYMGEGITANLENITIDNSRAVCKGGAIFSQGMETYNSKNNVLIFHGRATFNNNESTTNSGGAINAGNSDLIFKDETKFEGNKSIIYNGGAIALYSTRSNKKSSSLTFEKIVIFSANESKKDGGAIYSWGGDYINKNTLVFLEKAIFKKNRTTETFGKGGAISVVNSSLTFGGLVTFRGNSSAGSGGAIYGADGTKLTFGGDVIFRENSSVGDGGAVYFLGGSIDSKNTIKFRENVIFEGNKTKKSGGAIFIKYSSLIFEKLAIFENNSSASVGGAILASDGSSIEFRDGLRLIYNVTECGENGALQIWGDSDGAPAIITIVQRNPALPTEFRGNKSGGGEGKNAIYMWQYSQLNFIVEKDSAINIFD